MTSPVPLPELKERDKLSLPLFFAYVLLAAVLAAIAICALSAQIIRGVDDLLPHLAPRLGLDESLAGELTAIFAQLDHASLSVHHEVPSLLSFVFALCIGLFLRAGRKAVRFPFALTVVLAVLVGLIFITVSLALSVWMTDVNDIRFGDIVLSLTKMIRAGVLGSL
ncbi:MAG: hypothetical protein IJC71_08335 [Clostridia bacterium]|nr:hypothetical protein [Clostridia bacterium]